MFLPVAGTVWPRFHLNGCTVQRDGCESKIVYIDRGRPEFAAYPAVGLMMRSLGGRLRFVRHGVVNVRFTAGSVATH